MAHLLPHQPVTSLAEYRDLTGIRAIERARTLGPDGVVDAVRASGLRGRGGAGFPTGIKWAGLAASDAATKFVVCNAAEGEPGTFKDRALLRRNPYQVIEGLAVAAYATGARAAYIGIKNKHAAESDRLRFAAAELADEGALGGVEIVIVPGPDDYLFGEEKALLEVIEGKDPLPRLYPPYVQGLFEERSGAAQPATVNNVETLANIPHIVRHGPDWFRSLGTAESPGTMVCTIGGDVAVELVAELEMGTPLSELLRIAGGSTARRPVKIVTNGVSNAPLDADRLETPISFEAMLAAGSGLGSAGFTLYTDDVCAVQLAATASGFLYRGSCGQCPPCKLGTAAIAERFAALAMGAGDIQEVEEIAAWTLRVTDANRCGLGSGQRELARGILERFPDDVAHHVDGGTCPATRRVVVTTIEDWDENAGRFVYSPLVTDDAPGG